MTYKNHSVYTELRHSDDQSIDGTMKSVARTLKGENPFIFDDGEL